VYAFRRGRFRYKIFLRAFNNALLGKWEWKIKNERFGLCQGRSFKFRCLGRIMRRFVIKIKINKKYTRIKEMNRKDYCTFSFDSVKEHEYGSLKCEPTDSKLRFLLQSLHLTLENLLTKESMFYTIAHIDHNSMFIFINHYKETSSSSSSSSNK
jgi:hypothetical protein